ncbi:MAG: lipoate--protein ligase [Bacteroidales bacterium]|nr:lipoate--protein ligase [Bacteroidales bacterium]
MLIFYRLFTDAYLNIAAEEYFVKNAVEDMCMIWINERSVIIGKHQNAFAEINYPYVRAHNIPVIRRISGGGAVYHDAGNVNFTFIQKTDKRNQVDFKRFTSIIVNFMQSLGIEANTNKRNSIFAGDLKFSGHAEHIFHDRVLHHGTILFNTDIDKLQNCLTPEKEYQGKAMASVRSNVGNIAPLLSKTIDINQFAERFVNWLIDFYPGSNSYKIRPDELIAINELSETKYKTWQWNFGYSPAYQFQVNIPMLTGFLPINIKVENGKFIQISLPDETVKSSLSQVLRSMTGILHKEEEIDKFIENNRSSLELAGVKIVNFVNAFFN